MAGNNSEKAREVFRSGKDIREYVRKVTLDALDNGLDLERVKAVVSNMVRAASDAVSDAAPDAQQSALRQTFDGLADALDAAAGSAATAMSGVHRRGKGFASREFSRTVTALRDLEQQFLTTVDTASEHVTSQARSQWRLLSEEARRAGDRIRPHVNRARAAADGHTLEMLGEAATTTVKVARKATAAALGVASGVLAALSDRASPRAKPAKRKTKATGKGAASGKTAAKKKRATKARAKKKAKRGRQ